MVFQVLPILPVPEEAASYPTHPRRTGRSSCRRRLVREFVQEFQLLTDSEVVVYDGGNTKHFEQGPRSNSNQCAQITGRTFGGEARFTCISKTFGLHFLSGSIKRSSCRKRQVQESKSGTGSCSYGKRLCCTAVFCKVWLRWMYSYRGY